MARRAELALLLGAALLLLTGLGRTGLWAPDEPRYAHIAEEVRSLRHGAQGLVVLHLNGEVYTQKPPAYFWMAAAAGAPLGRVTEAAARLPSALAGVALVLLTFAFGQRLLSTRAGLLGAVLLLTTFDFGSRAASSSTSCSRYARPQPCSPSGRSVEAGRWIAAKPRDGARSRSCTPHSDSRSSPRGPSDSSCPCS
jgi:hypothetical protein